LTERPRDLCDEGFIKQERSNRQSQYRLTKRGEMLKPMLQSLYDWGEANAESFDVQFATKEQR
jgi:DNA-binding HxlR family transcriptional regulator